MRPLRGASMMTWPPEYSTERTLPSNSSCSGSSMLCTVSCTAKHLPVSPLRQLQRKRFVSTPLIPWYDYPKL